MMRRKIGKLLGDRRVVGGFLLLIQLAIVMFGVSWASTEYHWLTPALTVLSVIIVIWLVRKYDNPMYKITWMLVIVLLPLFGGLFLSLIHIFVVAGVHNEENYLKRHLAVPLEQLHQLCHQHGILAAGDAHGNLVARLNQLILSNRQCKRVPDGLAEFFDKMCIRDSHTRPHTR